MILQLVIILVVAARMLVLIEEHLSFGLPHGTAV